MVSKRAVAAVFLLGIAFAMPAQQPAEFGRATGTELVMKTKGSAPISGSLELSTSTGSDLLGRGRSTGYGLTAGGTLLEDRMWFFASAARQEGTARFADLALPENLTTSMAGARVDGQLGNSHDFSAYFESARRPELSMTGPSSFTTLTAPSTFLSLRYTGVVSSNAFFTASITKK